MNALKVQEQQNILPELKPDLFITFIRWIDRGPATTQSYINNLRQFAAWLKYKGITRPQRQDILSFRDYISGEHDAISLAPKTAAGWIYRVDQNGEPVKICLKPSTIAGYMQTVCQFFRWTAASGLYPDVAANIHTPRIIRDKHRRDYLKPAEIETIEKSIEAKAEEKTKQVAGKHKDTAGRIERSTEQGKRLYAMYELAVNGGLRCVELSRANVKDYETKGGRACIYIWGKGHAEPDQKKILAPGVAAAINDYLSSRKDNKTGNSPLFVATGNRWGGKRLAASTIGKMLKKALKDAGFNSDKLTAHSLRHSAAMGVLSVTNNNIYESQKYLRHENPATTEIYLHETEEQENQQADIAEQIYKLFHGQEFSESEDKARLMKLIKFMNQDQIKSLMKIAAAFTR